jgi:hypothetical protein
MMAKLGRGAVLGALACALSLSDAAAYQWSRKQATETAANARYEAESIRGLNAALKAADKRTCNFFGYQVSCVRTRLTDDQVLGIHRAALSKARPEIRRSRKAADTFASVLGNAGGTTTQPDGIPVLIVGRLPGYIPMAAYGGEVSPTYENLNKVEAEGEDQPNGADRTWRQFMIKTVFYDISGDEAALLKKLDAVQADYRFFAGLRDDAFGHRLFSVFAFKQDVTAADRIEKFWVDYARFSESYDYKTC